MKTLPLLPYPRSVAYQSGWYTLPASAVFHLDVALPRETVLLPLAKRMRSAARAAGFELELVTGPAEHPRLALRASHDTQAPARPDGYLLTISPKGVRIGYQQLGGLRAGVATLRQLLREFGRRLPCLRIRDYADFARRGVMLDIARGRVPKLETLLELVEHLADFKINEFQLYTEHTFAYRNYEPVWREWGALTAEEVLLLDERCRQLGIDLVPNQNSFGHLRYWLAYPPLKKLAEVSEPYPGADGTYRRYPATLAPNHPQTLPFLRELFDELLPCFSSSCFNVGCDETWDLGLGQSRATCERRGKGRVYLDFLKKIHREVSARDRRMMFWGDLILNHAELISELPRDAIALNWGYEATHPFEREASLFAGSKIPFYVCPGTSTWMSLVGRHDNAFANLQHAATAGQKFGAVGYLNTDWGDGGHPQPLAVSYLPYLAGAARSWCGESFSDDLLVAVLSRDVFQDLTQRVARAALALGLAHRKLDYYAPNVTPLGAAIAAPLPRTMEIPCRDGLKYYARIPEQRLRAALDELERQQGELRRSRPATRAAKVLVLELELASRMAVQSCRLMLWQQALAAGRNSRARQMAARNMRDLRELDVDFQIYWPLRNKGTTKKSAPFLRWRLEDYRHSRLQFPPERARVATVRKYTAE